MKNHTFQERPWARFEVLRDEDYYKTKNIMLLRGHRLSYQSYERRAEHWIPVKGVAQVTLEVAEKAAGAGEHVYIPLKAKHRIANTRQEPMEFVEIQAGTYFGEEDITRYSNDYRRT